MIDSVKEPASGLGLELMEGERALTSCPRNEEIWYDLVRAWEMLEELRPRPHPRSLQVGDHMLTSLAEATAEATRVVPTSPRIALIDARARPDLPRVAEVAARFPGFAPLGLALAQAELAASAPARAAEVFARTKGIKAVPGSAATLARIELALHDPRAALAALATKDAPSDEVKTAGSEAYERCGAIPRQRAFVRYQIELALGHPAPAVRALLDAAVLGSSEAEGLLTTLPPALAKALADARRKGKLTRFDKDLLRTLAEPTPKD